MPGQPSPARRNHTQHFRAFFPPPPLWQTRCPNVLEPLVMANKFLRQHAGARPPAPFAASRFSRSCADSSSTSEAWPAPSETASDMVLLRHQPQPPPPVKRVALVKLLCELQHLLEVETSSEPPTPGVVLGPLRLHRLARSHGCNPTVVCTVAGETAMAISASLGGAGTQRNEARVLLLIGPNMYGSIP